MTSERREAITLESVTVEVVIWQMLRKIDAPSPESLGQWLWDLIESLEVGATAVLPQLGTTSNDPSIAIRGSYRVKGPES